MVEAMELTQPMPPALADMTEREITHLAELSRQGVERGYVEYLIAEAKKLFAHPLDTPAQDFAEAIAGAQAWYVSSMRAIEAWEIKMKAERARARTSNYSW